MKHRFAPFCLCAALAGVVLSAASAGVFDSVLLKGRTDKADPVSYAVNEPIVFTLAAEKFEGVPATNAYFLAWTRTGDDGRTVKGKASFTFGRDFAVTTSLDRAGYVRLEARVVGADGKNVRRDKNAPGLAWGENHSIFFDGGAGVKAETLRPGVPEPSDFDAFWRRQKARLAAVPVTAQCVALSTNARVRVCSVRIACAGPRPVTGFLTVPVAASAAHPVPVQVCLQGYGTPIQSAPSDGPTDRIQLSINAHGYDLGRDKAYYDDFFDSIRTPKYSYAFSPAQNENPENAYFNGMALRVMRAFDYVKTLPEWNKKDLWAEGGSQGGLQTMWAAGLVQGLSKAEPNITWCCDLGGFKIGRMQAPWHIPYVDSLRYYDAVNFAKRVPATCPVHITRAGLGDYTCPPSGLSVLYNVIPGPKSIIWVQGSEHGYVPPGSNQTVTHSAP